MLYTSTERDCIIMCVCVPADDCGGGRGGEGKGAVGCERVSFCCLTSTAARWPVRDGAVGSVTG